MEKEDIETLMQIVEAMNDAAKKLEAYYNKRDIEKFNRAKKIILEFQKKIAQELVK